MPRRTVGPHRATRGDSGFYAALPDFADFAEFTDPAHYRPAPADWLVVVTDIEGSTRAIAEGRYKDVNMLAAAGIVAVLNVVGGTEIPFVFGGDGATLLVPPDGLPADALSGVDAAWQCWDGSTWVTTHIVYRGVEGLAGQTIPVNSEFQIRVPSIGLPLGVAYPIVIPDVDPGIYRIGDDVILDAGPVSGFVVVEVTGD